MSEDKVKMPADGSGTETTKPDDIGELASRRDGDGSGDVPNPGESGGGAYPTPQTGKDRGRFHGGQSVMVYHGKGQLGGKKLDDTHNTPAQED